MNKYVLLNYGHPDPSTAWGGEMILIGPLDHVGMLRTDLHLETHEDDGHEEVLACLQTDGGVVPYNGIYYSDWSLIMEDQLVDGKLQTVGEPQPLIGGDHTLPGGTRKLHRGLVDNFIGGHLENFMASVYPVPTGDEDTNRAEAIIFMAALCHDFGLDMPSGYMEELETLPLPEGYPRPNSRELTVAEYDELRALVDRLDEDSIPVDPDDRRRLHSLATRALDQLATGKPVLPPEKG